MMVQKVDKHNETHHFNEILKTVPLAFRNSLITDWEAINGNYPVQLHAMPQPVWKTRGYDDTSRQVWERIQTQLLKKSNTAPISIYLHIPFCKDKKCGFCDCLSVPMQKDSPIELFVATLINEIKCWSRIAELKHQPVSVIYFGGGTPNSLPDYFFEQIVRALFNGFSVSTESQISVECPGKLLNQAKLDFLKSLHVNRISIGIQTLEEPLRYQIGRNSSRAEILNVIRQSKAKGIITCGDIIYGLPQQRMTGYIDSLQKLIDMEIDGLSLYRFVVSHRNQEFISKNFKNYQKDELLNYICLHIAHQMLAEAGYHKNHFIHFAKKDDNRYYRHLVRGEDLIAMGPTADGIIGSYRYRHPRLKKYLATNQPAIPIFEGGITESAAALKIKPATTQLMGGEIDEKTVSTLNLTPVIKKWEACRIVEKSATGSWRLLANGSWLIDQLLDEVDRVVNG